MLCSEIRLGSLEGFMKKLLENFTEKKKNIKKNFFLPCWWTNCLWQCNAMIMISPRQPTLPLLFLSICVSNIYIPLYWGQTDLTFPRLLKYCEEAASTREWRWTTEPSSRWQTRSRKGSSAERSLALSKAAQSMLGWRVQRRQYWRETNDLTWKTAQYKTVSRHQSETNH